MITLSPQSSIAVIGFGRVGHIITQYLLQKRMVIYAYDDNEKIFEQKELINLTHNSQFKIINNYRWPMRNKKPKFAICSPGFSEQSKIIKFLRSASIPIFDEIEITQHLLTQSRKLRLLNKFSQWVYPYIAITGTNGKSTTTSLLGRILDADGRNVFWGGNLAPGLPFSITLFQESKDYYVIEVSSFQLERCLEFHPHIAILLNITADHLDRHTSFLNYQKTKFKIFSNQTKKDYAIINYEDEISMMNRDLIQSKIVYFSKNRKVKGAYLANNQIFYNDEKICSLDIVKLFGSQYIDSILASICAAKLIGIKNKSIINVLKNFSGLEHRLEFIAEINGVKYINNSMCTNPSAGVATLESFNKPVILITGGKEKNLDVNEYIKVVINKTKYTILIGENRKRLAKLLKTKNYNDFHIVDLLKKAVTIATKHAYPGDIVLFSPGFASFDSFSNFQERGNIFKEIVYALQ